jgi:teichuronic acid biosynthesis glycosyltransferase TuaC
MDNPVRVLIVTSEWPTVEHPEWAPFIVQEVKFLRLAGLEVDVFSFRGAKNPFNYIRAWLDVHRIFRRQHYDLVHAQFGQSGVLVIPACMPLVVTFRGSDLLGIISDRKHRYTIEGYVLNLVSRMVASLANEIILVSGSLAGRLPREIRYRRHCHIIPGGVDLDLFKPSSKQEARDTLKLPHNRTLILFGGKPDVARKRYKLARQALYHLDGRYDLQLIVPKDVPHHLMPLYMNASDVLLLTSIHEGSPNVVKEALACNLPVVSVDVGDVRELISHIPGCVVCHDARAETIAAALTDVLERHACFNSRDLLEKQLDASLQAQKVISIYNRMLQNQQQRGNRL